MNSHPPDGDPAPGKSPGSAPRRTRGSAAPALRDGPERPRAAFRLSNVPVLELLMVVALAPIGWATYLLWQSAPEAANAGREAEALRQAFNRAHDLYRQSGISPEQSRRESDEFWKEALRLAPEYHAIADRLQKTTNFLQNLLALPLLRGPEPEHRKERLDSLDTWIQKEMQRVALESLGARSSALMAHASTNGPEGPKDLGTLLREADAAYRDYRSNYLALITVIRTETRKPALAGPAAPSLGQSRGAAAEALARLARLGDRADQYDQDIQAFLKAKSRDETIFQTKVLQPLFNSVSATEFARRVKPEPDNDPAWSGSLREAFWLLVFALGGLGVVLAVGVYRRGVVVPLHLRLAEREGYLEQQKKLERLEEVAAGLAHEIRNPLTTMSARLHMIRRRLEEGAPEDKNALVIMREIERVNQILGEFIQLTRPATPRLEVMSAAPLLEEVGELLRPDLERQGLELNLECDLDGQGRFYGDAQQLKQVLINLVQNAAESMAGHGAVTLRAKPARTTLKGRPDNVTVIEVADTGPGIPPQVRQHLFEPFFSTKKGGTGLGLPISARIIDRHGGELDFDTEIGHGTTFRIVLPAYDRP